MIDELSAHLLDIVMNSITAGAKHVNVSIEEDKGASLFNMEVTDDGKGMDAEMVRKVQDPFFSTKTGRKVGLGIPLLKETAEETGGNFLLESEPGRGTRIVASFNLYHPDLPVLGNLKDTIFVLVVGHPDVDFSFRYKSDKNDFVLDTADMKKELQEVPINHPEVVFFLRKYLDDHL